jgi:hypothetical protein
MADDKPTLRETTNRSEQRRNPRFPNSTIWSEEQRRQHREERDSVIEDAGLVTDRVLEDKPDA